MSLLDNCNDLQSENVFIVAVSSDEMENEEGDGNTFDDIIISQTKDTVYLRAERNEYDNGRVYTILIQADDLNGNTTIDSSYVYVPIEKNEFAIDDGLQYIVECLENTKSVSLRTLQNSMSNEFYNGVSLGQNYPNPCSNLTVIEFNSGK